MEILELVERLLAELPKLGTSDQNIAQLEEEIDRLVYKLYDLEPEEIVIIEEALK